MATFVCPSCGYTYDEVAGDPREGWAPGTPFAAIDPDWPCPDCGVRDQQDFEQLAG
jgi:rubredoxin